MPTEPLGEPRPPQFTLRGLFVLTTLVALALSIIVPAIRLSRDAARKSTCVNNMRQLGLGIHCYFETQREFPSAYTSDAKGRRLHNWRTKLQPYLWGDFPAPPEYFHMRWDEPWDSPNNSPVRAWSAGVFRCPADDVAAKNPGNASYLAVVGAETLWPGRTPAKLPAMGANSPGSETPASQTILLVETVNSGIHWMEPRDLTFDTLDCSLNGPSKPGISSNHAEGVNVLFLDGGVRCLPWDTPADTIKRMLTNPARDSEPASALEKAAGRK